MPRQALLDEGRDVDYELPWEPEPQNFERGNKERRSGGALLYVILHGMLFAASCLHDHRRPSNHIDKYIYRDRPMIHYNFFLFNAFSSLEIHSLKNHFYKCKFTFK